nr:acyltransferase [uncultured Noviherbaspirillum sp.]
MTGRSNASAAARKLSGIEAARGIAAILVVFYHAARHLNLNFGIMPLNGVAQFGHAGVDFFFVLSGFIIFYVHRKDVGKPSSVATYFERRFTRIYPLFWFSLAVALVLTYFSSTQPFPGPLTILQHATLLPFGGDVGVAWTLQHEIMFYLIFAVALLHRQLGIALFAGWFCFILVAWGVGEGHTDSPVLARLASTYNLEFFFGILAAVLMRKLPTHLIYPVLAIGIGAFASFSLAENMGRFNAYTPVAPIAYGLSSMLIVIGIAAANQNGWLSAPRFLTQLGTASYATYLLHIPCIGVYYKLLTIAGLHTAMPLDVLYLLLVTSAIGSCIVISRMVEYPLMQLVRSALTRRAGISLRPPQQTLPLS